MTPSELEELRRFLQVFMTVGVGFLGISVFGTYLTWKKNQARKQYVRTSLAISSLTVTHRVSQHFSGGGILTLSLWGSGTVRGAVESVFLEEREAATLERDEVACEMKRTWPIGTAVEVWYHPDMPQSPTNLIDRLSPQVANIRVLRATQSTPLLPYALWKIGCFLLLPLALLALAWVGAGGPAAVLDYFTK
ncbi:MAG: hypothetical protein HYZ53_16145 [Planctomycetes bacterium]|nr:hypothetical protein [Planctomycetota bacterium]